MTAADAYRAILAVWRIEQPRLITSLARMLRDVPLAEELTQDALLAALERWPVTGVPERPGAWLMATAKRRALDHLRRGPMLGRSLQRADLLCCQGASWPVLAMRRSGLRLDRERRS
jgi:predicted RNA polymerase sigma factor